MRRSPTINGLPVVNGTMTLAIEVVHVDVEKGVPNDHQNCPFSQAARRQLGIVDIRTARSRTCVRFDHADCYVRYETPKALCSETISFDRSGFFQEGTYYLKPLKEYAKPTGKRQGSDTNDDLTHKKRERRVIQNVRSAIAYD